MYILAHIRESPKHLSPDIDFQDLSRNGWTDPRAHKNPEATPDVSPARPLGSRTYLPIFPSQLEVLPQESETYSISPRESTKTRSAEPPPGLGRPLTARRLKPIRQKTKKAVVGLPMPQGFLRGPCSILSPLQLCLVCRELGSHADGTNNV